MIIFSRSITDTSNNKVLSQEETSGRKQDWKRSGYPDIFFSDNMNTGRETFYKTERLCSRKIFSDLFEKGNIFYTSAFKIVWLISPVQIPSPAQVAFSVSKKTFKKAVTRNLIKRRMREAYRKMKYNLYDILEAENKQLTFIIVYRGNTAADFASMENAMKEVLDKLSLLTRGNQQKS